MDELSELTADIFEYYGTVRDLNIPQRTVALNSPKTCYNWTALHEACKNSQIERCKEIIRGEGMTFLSVEDHEQRTPIFLAVSNRNKEICKVLIEAGADIFRRNMEGSTLLHIAVKENDYELCEMLVAYGIDVNATNRIGQSPIFLVDFVSQKNILALLLSSGASLELQDHLCMTPMGKFGFPALLDMICSSSSGTQTLAHACGGPFLHIAVKNRYRENVETLLLSGADANARDKDGSTPLHRAVSVFWSEGCSLLLSRGADVNAADHDGNTALHKVRDRGICQLLLQFGADASFVNGKGFAPLYEAVISNNEMVVSAILELGKANTNLCPHGGQSALHVALRLCHFMMCVLLLMAGADPNAVGEGSESNLMVAHPYRHLVSLLLAAGAKPPYNSMDFGYEPSECVSVAAAETQPRAQLKGPTTVSLVQKLLDMHLGSALFAFLSTATIMRIRCVCKALRDAPQSFIHFPPGRALYRVSRYCEDAAIQRVVAALPHLATLRLAGCSLITDRTLRSLAESPTLAVGLVHLNLFNCASITDVGLGYLGKLSSLQYLNVGWCVRITDQGIEAFVRNMVSSHLHLEKALQLRTLILSKCDNITDGMLHTLCRLNSLRELHLSWCPFVTAIGLSHNLGTLPCLTHLFVANCNGIDLAAKIALGQQFPNLLVDCIWDSRNID